MKLNKFQWKLRCYERNLHKITIFCEDCEGKLQRFD